MRKKCPYSKLFWSASSRIPTEYEEEILRISPYSVGMRENADQNKFEYGQFLQSVSSDLNSFILHCFLLHSIPYLKVHKL